MIRFLKRGRMTDDDQGARLAPVHLPYEQRAPMRMHFRFWRWDGGLMPAGMLEGAARVRLDYILGRPPYVAGSPVPPMRSVGADVAIAGPVARHEKLAAVWVGALTTPIAIEMWSKDPVDSQSSMNAGGRTHLYAILPLLRADSGAQHQEPEFTDGRGCRHPAYRFRAEPGNAWGTGPLAIQYDADTRQPARLSSPMPMNHMWHLQTTELHPDRALAIGGPARGGNPEQVPAC